MPEVTMSMDWQSMVLFVLRWIHLMAGITWIGHLYFFNLVAGPFEKTMDGDTKKKVVPELRPRALWWFRWGAMFTLLSGLLYIFWGQFVISNASFKGWFDSTNGKWITFGAALGIIMWFNVWFIIWPAQKKIIGWIKNGQKPPEMDGTIRTAFLASRTNTYLSVPMLFGMGAATHFGIFEWYWPVAVMVVGMLIAHMFIKLSPKVGTFK